MLAEIEKQNIVNHQVRELVIDKLTIILENGIPEFGISMLIDFESIVNEKQKTKGTQRKNIIAFKKSIQKTIIKSTTTAGISKSRFYYDRSDVFLKHTKVHYDYKIDCYYLL